MATIDQYKIKITVEGKEQVVDLNNSVDKLQGTLTKFSAAGVAAFTALGISAMHMADEMSDLSDATGISVGKIYQLSSALQASGSDFDNGGKLLQQFSNTLTDVENGSDKAIKALTDLGLTKQQIEGLSDEQLFQAAVNGLGKMQAGFERTRIATELFGKAAMGIDWQKLAAGTNKAVDPGLEKRLRDAGDAIDNLQAVFRDLELAVLQALGPVIQKIKDMNITADDLKTGIKLLGAAIAGAFAASVVIQIVKVVNVFKQLYQTARAAGAAAAFLEGLSGVGLLAVAASAAAATAAYKALGVAMEDTADKQGALGEITPTAQNAGNVRTQGTTEQEKALAALKAQTAELQNQNAAALRYQKILNDTIGMDEQDANVKKLTAQLEIDRANSRANYEKQIAALKADNTKNNTEQIKQLDLQKNIMDAQLVKMYDLKKEAIERENIEKAIANNLQEQLSAIQLQSDKNKANTQAELQRQLIAGKITQEEMDNQMKLNTIREDAAAKAMALDKQIAAEHDDYRRDDLQRQKRDLEERTKLELEQAQNVINEKKAMDDSYRAGAVAGLKELADSFTPYNMAQKAIMDTWNNIDDAFTNFVKNGKLSFKDLASSIIQDLSMMIAKAELFKLYQTVLGSLGLSLPGKADGGPVKQGQPYMVGERGPELFVPKQAGSIIPNDKINNVQGRQSTNTAPANNTYITNNITAMDSKSVAQVFTENRKSLFGAYQIAGREMSYAGGTA